MILLNMTERRLIMMVFNAEKLIRKTFNPSYYLVNIEHTDYFINLRQQFWMRSVIQVPDIGNLLADEIDETLT